MEKLRRGVYRVVFWLVKLFYKKTELVGLENLPEQPCLVVGNHAQMHGPIVSELYFPGARSIWCAGEMMKLAEVPDYAFHDFWPHKPRYIQWFYRLLSYLIAPLSVCVFNSAHTIPVYHDHRVISTFRTTLARLKAGDKVIVFPEYAEPHNHIVYDFQEGFVDVARSYYKQTGQALLFVPMYLAPALHQAVIGKPIAFRPEAPIADERERICHALMADITAMAESLPRHRVVPYLNIAKSQYGYNRKKEENTDETAGG